MRLPDDLHTRRNPDPLEVQWVPEEVLVTSGTLLHSRKLSIRDHLAVIALFVNGVKGASALQMSRNMNVGPKSMFVMLHKLREAMGATLDGDELRGEVEIDGAYFGKGPKQANRKADRPDRRTLEMLKILDEEVRKSASAKGGATGFLIFLSWDWALSDEAWQGLLTAREIQSRLVDAPGDRDAKEVRRLARKLGIRLAEDQRGRKQNPYLPKQEPSRPRGRPRTKPDIGFTNDLEAREAMKVAAATGKTPVRGADY